MESGLWWGSQSEGTAEVEMRAGVWNTQSQQMITGRGHWCAL